MIRKTDTRKLKRTADGYFTTRRIHDIDKDDDTLCGYCGRNACPLLATLAGKTLVNVKACREFIPILSFSVLTGLHEPIFNTIRLGLAWPKRLDVGDRVRVMDTKNGAFLRVMRVKEFATGSLGEIVTHHAHRNHALIASDAPDKPAEMMRVLRGAYGSTYTHTGRSATAIYLEDEWHCQNTSRKKASKLDASPLEPF